MGRGVKNQYIKSIDVYIAVKLLSAQQIREVVFKMDCLRAIGMVQNEMQFFVSLHAIR
jgi:hypothetical protein